jgi:hypothetical protein
MRTPNGFDRLSTEEELNQVLAVLQESTRSGWVFPGEDSTDLDAATHWPGTIADDSLEADCLAEMMEQKPTLKN